MKVYYDPRLIEETVFLVVRDKAEAKAFYHERNRSYGIMDPEEREHAFKEIGRAWFVRLGLAEGIEKAIDEQPLLSSGIRHCLVGLASRKRDEGAELFVRAEQDLSEEERRRLRILLRPESLAEPPALLTFLRHELLHITDMLDPQFGYEPELPVADVGPVRDRLIRNRYRTLWDVTIDGRMVCRGWAPSAIRAERLRDFRWTFSMLGEETNHLFSYFFDQEPHTHAELVAFALNPKGAAGGSRETPHPGSRCPLCGFPSYSFEPEPERLSQDILAQITGDFPGWDCTQGLCIQCADLYRARQVSACAAIQLPGSHPQRSSS